MIALAVICYLIAAFCFGYALAIIATLGAESGQKVKWGIIWFLLTILWPITLVMGICLIISDLIFD